MYAAKHPNDPPNERSLSRITTAKIVGKPTQERFKGLGFYQTITGMIGRLGLGEFEGRQHCGLDVSCPSPFSGEKCIADALILGCYECS